MFLGDFGVFLPVFSVFLRSFPCAVKPSLSNSRPLFRARFSFICKSASTYLDRKRGEVEGAERMIFGACYVVAFLYYGYSKRQIRV